MKVRMKEFKTGSNDGFNTKEFKVGMAYAVPSEMSEYLAKAWLQSGACEVDSNKPAEKKIIEPEETKEAVKKTAKRTRKKKV